MEKIISVKEIEHSIQTKFKIETFSKFLKALDIYELISEGDKIAIGISGGKDSLLLAKMLQILQRFSRVKFDLEFIAMDPGFSAENRTKLEKICQYMGIPIKIFETEIFDIVREVSKEKPCYLCARMRRGNLYAKAKELGCNKLALGHHFNDVIETILMGVMWSGSFNTMMPKLKSENFENLELIRPMYLIEEKNIIEWINYTGIKAMGEACPLYENCGGSQRANIKKLIENLKIENPSIEKNIFRSSENVQIDRVISYIKNGKKHSFLDEYTENKADDIKMV